MDSGSFTGSDCPSPAAGSAVLAQALASAVAASAAAPRHRAPHLAPEVTGLHLHANVVHRPYPLDRVTPVRRTPRPAAGRTEPTRSWADEKPGIVLCGVVELR